MVCLEISTEDCVDSINAYFEHVMCIQCTLLCISKPNLLYQTLKMHQQNYVKENIVDLNQSLEI